MKSFSKVFVTVLLFVAVNTSINAQDGAVSVGKRVPDASAILEVYATNKGVLLPRVALTGITDLTTISPPVNSMIVYNTATVGEIIPGYYYWDSATTKWKRLIIDADITNGLTVTNGIIALGGALTSPTTITTDATKTLTLAGLQTGATSDKLVVSSGSGILKTIDASISGDVSGNIGAVTVDKLKGTSLSIGSLNNNDLLKFNGTNWANAAISTLGTITLTTGSTGNDVNVSGSPANLGGTLTLNVPDAGATARGLVSTNTQTFGGAKTFSVAPAVTTFSTAGVVHNSSAGLLSSSTIVNADVSASAAIDGSKITPAFGSQSVSTTGTLSSGAITSSGDVAVNGGDITTTATSATVFNTTATTLDIGGAATTLRLGAASGTTTLKGATLNLGTAATASVGTIVLEDGNTGTFNVSLKAPALVATSNKTITLPDASGTVALVGDLTATVLTGDIGGTVGANTIGTGKVTSIHIADGVIVNADIHASAAIDGSKIAPAFGSQNVSTTGTLSSAAITSSGDVAVNGGDITTTSTTANVFNATATTLNIGGAATTLGLGATSGTTTVNNDLGVTGGDITTTATSATVFNTNTTTLDIGGAATTLRLGAASGTTTLKGATLNLGTAATASVGTIVLEDGNTGTFNVSLKAPALVATSNKTITLPDASGTVALVGDLTATVLTGDIGGTVGANTIGTGKVTSSHIADGVIVNADIHASAAIDGSKITPAFGSQNVSTTGTLSSGAITSSGDVAVNSGKLNTTATTAYLFNTGATTLNIGGAASALGLGATSGTTTVNNDLGVTGGDITTTATSATVFNTNATTLNIGGVATTLSLGTASGTTILKGATLNLGTAATASAGKIVLEDGNTGTFNVSLSAPALVASSNKAITLPDASGMVALISDLTATVLTGDIGGTVGANTIGTGKVTSNHIADGTIVNADVSASAAIDGSKITPAFGSQNVSTTGTLSSAAITSSGDVAVNGGDITTTSTTANVFNATATTLNIGGAATTLGLGAAAGTTTFNGNTSLAANKSLAYVAGTGTFDQSLSSGTFKTGTGAVSLNGATTVSGGALTLGVPATATAGKIIFNDANTATNTATLAGPVNVSTSYTLTLPDALGAVGQILKTDASGNLSWVTPSAAFNNLTSATSANTAIDNFNFAQTWNWSTADDENPLTINANGLTSGTGLSIASTSLGLTGSLQKIWLTTNAAANTGTLLDLKSSGANSLAKTLVSTNASTGNLSAGGVQFNFTGAHTGAGVGIIDATQTGTALNIKADALTDGNALNISSTSTAASAGSKLVNITASGVNASVASTTAVSIVNSRSNGPSYGLSVSSTDYALVVPSGKVGIGMLTPTAYLQLANGTIYVAPLKLSEGTKLTNPESGAIEYDGDHLYFTDKNNVRLTLDRQSLSLTTPSGSNANGGSISSNALSLSFADAINPGLVSTTAQTFAGAKSFSSDVATSGNFIQYGANTFSTGTGAVSLNGATTVSGGSLTLGTAATAASIGKIQFEDGNTGTFNVSLSAPALVAASNKIITLPDASGTLALVGNLTATALTGDIGGTVGANTIGTGKVTSNHIADGAIINADINASAAIAGSKITPTFSADVSTTGGVYVQGGTLTLGVSTSSNVGSIKFEDGSAGNPYNLTLSAPTTVALSNKTITLPDLNGTILVSGSNGLTSNSGSVSLGGSLTTPTTITTDDTNTLKITSPSTGFAATGGVQFSFTGNHGGSGVGIDDATLTGTAMTIKTNSLTSGSGLSIASTSTGLSGKLQDISLTGSNVANTGTLLNLNSSGVASVAKTLVSTIASTGALPATGGVRFSFTGAHTGTGVGIDDITATGTVLNIAANSLTTGNGLSLASSSTALTGSLQDISLTGSNAASTGTLLNLNSSGVASVAKTLVSTIASTGALPATGGVQFSFTGAHTGSGVGIDDITATGTVLKITADALTSGTALNISSSSTTATSSSELLNIAATGVNTNATTAAVIANTRTTGTNIGLNVKASGGTAANYALIVPSGDVGIGTIAPKATLHNAGSTILGVAIVSVSAATYTVPLATVDDYSGVVITQTTVADVVTLTAPTDKTAGRIFTVSNKSSSAFPIVVGSSVIPAGQSCQFVWDGTGWSGSGIISPSNVTMVAPGATNFTYTATVDDETILVNPDAGFTVEIALPTAVGNKGKKYTVKKADASQTGIVKVISASTIDNIPAATGIQGSVAYQGWVFQSDGTEWWIIGKF